MTQTKLPPLKKVYWTAELGKVAIAKLQGGITWSERIIIGALTGSENGILLFDNLQAAYQYIKQRAEEDSAVIVEIPVKRHIDLDGLKRCDQFQPPAEFTEPFRQWSYTAGAIVFDRVKFHTIQEVPDEPEVEATVALVPKPVTGSILASSKSGNIILPV